MKFAALNNLNGCSEYFFDCSGEFLTAVTTISERIFYSREISFILFYHFNCPSSVSDISCCDCNGVRKSIGINGNVALDARNFLARIVTFFFGGVGVFYRLRVNDYEASFFFPTIVSSGLSN